MRGPVYNNKLNSTFSLNFNSNHENGKRGFCWKKCGEKNHVRCGPSKFCVFLEILSFFGFFSSWNSKKKKIWNKLDISWTTQNFKIMPKTQFFSPHFLQKKTSHTLFTIGVEVQEISWMEVRVQYVRVSNFLKKPPTNEIRKCLFLRLVEKITPDRWRIERRVPLSHL